jgi:hypothetical protein
MFAIILIQLDNFSLVSDLYKSTEAITTSKTTNEYNLMEQKYLKIISGNIKYFSKSEQNLFHLNKKRNKRPQLKRSISI